MIYTFNEIINPFKPISNSNIELEIIERLKDLIDIAIFNNSQEKEYANVVNYLIRRKYSQSSVEAITQNFLDDQSNIMHYNEFKELQEYRKQAKAKAKELLKIE